MKNSNEILLSLLRSALWDSPPDDIDFIPDWSEVLISAERQTVTGLVATAITGLPAGLKPDPAQMRKLQARMMRIYQSHALLNRKVAETVSRLNAAGIRSVLLKGQGTALNYHDPLARQCGDIDLYVGERQFLQTLQTMSPGKEHKFSRQRYPKHFNISEDGVEIEIHRLADSLPGAKADKAFQKWTLHHLEESELRIAAIGGVEINLPPAEFDALYIMNHAWHHFLIGGIGLRQICDWTMHLHRFHKVIDSKKLAADLDTFGLTRAWQIFASLAIRKLGLPVEECPLYNGEADMLAEKVMDMIWAEGNFGYHSILRKDPRPDGFIAGKLYTFRINTLRVFRIMSICPMDMIRYWIDFLTNGIMKVIYR